MGFDNKGVDDIETKNNKGQRSESYQDNRYTRQRAEVLLALEKRYVFTVEHLDVVAPAYQHLLDKLARLRDTVEVVFLDTSFRQFFCYERGKDMVLMKLKA